MASGKSAWLENTLLDLVFGATAWTPPASIFFALSLSAYDPAATGDTLDEPPGSASYARVEQANDTTNFPAAIGAAPAQKFTNTDVNFPTATSDWGTVMSIYTVDADTGGNVLYGADLPFPVPMTGGSSFQVPANNGVFSET